MLDTGCDRRRINVFYHAPDTYRQRLNPGIKPADNGCTAHRGEGYAMNATTLLLSILFGSIGMGLFVFGKKQGRPLHLIAGMLLMVLPYIIPNAIAMSIVAVIVTIGPFLAPAV